MLRLSCLSRQQGNQRPTMTDRTLYERIYRSVGKAYPKPHPDAEWVDGYWSVPVEPCKHGNYAPHAEASVYHTAEGVPMPHLVGDCDGKPEADDES